MMKRRDRYGGSANGTSRDVAWRLVMMFNVRSYLVETQQLH